MPTKLTPEIITAAIAGFEEQKRNIDSQIAELRSMLSGSADTAAVTTEATPGKRRKFSASARKRMKEAQQRRWAKIRGESEPAPAATPEPAKAKRKLSEAGRAAIVKALKKRWAAKKAAAKKAVPVAKKATVKKVAKKAAPVRKPTAKKSAPVAAQTTEVAGQ